MVKFFEEEDMVSFGNYLLSPQRKKRVKGAEVGHKSVGVREFPSSSELESMVSHADFENWKDDIGM